MCKTFKEHLPMNNINLFPAPLVIILSVIGGLWLFANLIALVAAADNHYFTKKELWDRLKNRTPKKSNSLFTSPSGNSRYYSIEIGTERIRYFRDGELVIEDTGRGIHPIRRLYNWSGWGWAGLIMYHKWRALYKDIKKVMDANAFSSELSKAEIEEYKSFK